MVRFIIIINQENRKLQEKIYIPIWLDLLYNRINDRIDYYMHLHSNMVRFIMVTNQSTKNIPVNIYIPIWLDLLFTTSPGISIVL